MVQPKRDEPIELNYAAPPRELARRARNAVGRTAVINMAFAASSVLTLFLNGEASTPAAVHLWLAFSGLFAISYCFLLIQIGRLAGSRGARVPAWVSLWAIVIGSAVALACVGFIFFAGIL